MQNISWTKTIGFAALIVVAILLSKGYFATSNNSGSLTQNPTPPPPIVVPPPPPPIQEPEPSPTPPPLPASIPTEIVRGNTSKQQVIFTFDGGAGNHSGEEILSVLAKHNVKGTFFLTGKFADQNPGLTKRFVDEGHEIFNHTYNHPYLTELTDAEIIKEFADTETAIKRITGKSTKPYFRPPYGSRTPAVLKVAAAEGYQSVFWTLDALDWKVGITEAEVKKRILDKVEPGAIYLMHIGDDITGNILDEVFTEIKSRNYSIVSLTEGLK